MDRQKYLDIVASRLSEMGVSEEEMVRPLRTFEQFLIDNGDDELYRSLEDEDELDDLIQNIYMMILKRRQRRAQKNGTVPVMTAAEAVPQPQTQPEMLVPQPITVEMQAVHSTDDPVTEPHPAVNVPDETENTATPVFENPQPIAEQPQSGHTYESDDMTDMDATVTMNRISSEASEPVDEDRSSTRTIDVVRPEAVHPSQETTTHNNRNNHNIANGLNVSRRPFDTYEKPKKLTRAEAKQESLHMYEDLPKISDPTGMDYRNIDPTAFDAEIPVKGSLAFWLIFILTLPITIPILAALCMIFIAVFAAMAVLIVGFIALLVVDVIAGTGLSLVGIIYGITQTFTVVPIGLYEIGLGIIIGGAALFIGILFYNAAIRLLPYLCRKWYDFFCFSFGQLGRLFKYLKKESAKA